MGFASFFEWEKTVKNFSRFVISLKRFIDDIFGGWRGTNRQFSLFIEQFNKFGSLYGIGINIDKCQCSHSVNFLDVVVCNEGGVLKTSLYVKATDANRYLNYLSYHPAHTFKGLPYSQMRRAALICSDPRTELNRWMP